MEEQQCLYHYPICPICRKIRFMLYLNNVENCFFRIEEFWNKREKFCSLNPTGEVPFLAIQMKDFDGKKTLLLWGQNTILDYLRKKYPLNTLLNGNIENQANIMKFNEFFDTKFYYDSTKPLLEERVYTFYKKKRNSNINIIKLARLNLEQHIRFVENILNIRDFIVGNEFSLADLSLACQLSSLDYLGEIDWHTHQVLKEWYVPIKSKPAFRELLYDIIPDFRPSIWYRELDF